MNIANRLEGIGLRARAFARIFFDMCRFFAHSAFQPQNDCGLTRHIPLARSFCSDPNETLIANQDGPIDEKAKAIGVSLGLKSPLALGAPCAAG